MFTDHHELEDAEILHGELFEPGRDAHGFFEPADTALDDVAPAIRNAVELKRPATSCTPVLWPFLLRNHCTYAVLSEPAAHCWNVVAFIARNHARVAFEGARAVPPIEGY